MAPGPEELRILCLGASLVAGYCEMGGFYHPFSHNLIEALDTPLPQTDIDVDVDGLPGDFVTTGSFIERMKKRFAEAEENEPFHWTIILGGTDDLAFLIDVDAIMEALKEIWATAIAHGSKVLALTVPGAIFDCNNPPLVARRNELNQKIMDYEADGFYVFDLYNALPCDPEHADLWDDAIHFTPEGYDVMGEEIAYELSAIILNEYEDDEDDEEGEEGEGDGEEEEDDESISP